jgi:hypothetical protein
MGDRHGRVGIGRFPIASFVDRMTATTNAAEAYRRKTPMQYALLIYTVEPTEAVPDDAMAAEMDAYNAFTEHVRSRDAYRAGEALLPTATATTVRVRDGQTLTTDGPFAETKEQLGGLYVVEAADIDEAIAYAAMIPGAKHGSIEVRPIVDFAAVADDGADTGVAEPVRAG